MIIKELNDINEIENIVNEFDNEFDPKISIIVGDLRQYSMKLYKYAKTIVLSNDNDNVGFASFYCNDNIDKTAFLSQIAVKKQYSGNGLGNILLSNAERISKENGMEYMKLEVYNHNTFAINFYLKNNYEFTSEKLEKSKYMIKKL